MPPWGKSLAMGNGSQCKMLQPPRPPRRCSEGTMLRVGPQRPLLGLVAQLLELATGFQSHGPRFLTGASWLQIPNKQPKPKSHLKICFSGNPN